MTEANTLRPRMMAVAYRMLGSVADAEDATQDAFLRYHTVGGVSSPNGFLIRTTTRLCLDRLRVRKRAEHTATLMPNSVTACGQEFAQTESLTTAFRLLLERLTPNERAAFLLRAVFDYEYAAVGEVVGRPEVTARQLVSRARRQLGPDGERRFPATESRAAVLAEQFAAACRAGNMRAIEQMLTEGVESHPGDRGPEGTVRITARGECAPRPAARTVPPAGW